MQLLTLQGVSKWWVDAGSVWSRVRVGVYLLGNGSDGEVREGHAQEKVCKLFTTVTWVRKKSVRKGDSLTMPISLWVCYNRQTSEKNNVVTQVISLLDHVFYLLWKSRGEMQFVTKFIKSSLKTNKQTKEKHYILQSQVFMTSFIMSSVIKKN